MLLYTPCFIKVSCVQNVSATCLHLSLHQALVLPNEEKQTKTPSSPKTLPL